MRLTGRQRRDLETIEYFIPNDGSTPYGCGAVEDEGGEGALEVFLDWSDRGVRVRGRRVKDLKRLEQLLGGKRWRGIYVGIWEEGVLEGSVPYEVLLEGKPEGVVRFMAKEMFQGMDKGIILKIYEKNKKGVS